MKKYFFILFIYFISNLFLFAQSPPGWIQQNSGTSLKLRDIFFINKNTGWIVGGIGGYSPNGIIIKTTNSGLNWNTQLTNISELFYKVFFVNQNIGYAVGGNVAPGFGADKIVLKTTNGGQNWITMLSNTQSPCPLSSIHFFDSITGFVGSYNGDGILKTTNGGINFINTNEINVCYDMQFTDSNTGYFGGEAYVFKTTNRGNNWTQVLYEATYNISDLFFVNSFIGYAVGHNTVIKTTNGGFNWTKINGNDYIFRTSIHFSDINHGAYIGTNVYTTTNGGLNWTFHGGFLGGLMSVYFINNDTGWVCGDNGVICRTTTGGNPIGIKLLNQKIPNKYHLYQNFPNPFNPQTSIKYDIKNNSLVKIIIYDLLGHEIQTLVNQKHSVGTYEVNFISSENPSGIYFYSLFIDGIKIDTKKMLLIK